VKRTVHAQLPQDAKKKKRRELVVRVFPKNPKSKIYNPKEKRRERQFPPRGVYEVRSQTRRLAYLYDLASVMNAQAT
jgi:hypothetical protein